MFSFFYLSTAFGRDYLFDYEQVAGYCWDPTPGAVTHKVDRPGRSAEQCEAECNYGDKCSAYHTTPSCVHYTTEILEATNDKRETDFCYIKKFKLAGPGRCVKNDGSLPLRHAYSFMTEQDCADMCTTRHDCGGYNWGDDTHAQRCNLWIHDPADLREGGSGETYGVGESVCKIKYLFDNNYSTEVARECERKDCGDNAQLAEGDWPNCVCHCQPGFYGDMCNTEAMWITQYFRGDNFQPAAAKESYATSIGLPFTFVQEECMQYGDAPWWDDGNFCQDDEEGLEWASDSTELIDDDKHDCEIYDAICDGLFTAGSMITQQTACSSSAVKLEVLELCTAVTAPLAATVFWYAGAQITCNVAGNVIWAYSCGNVVSEFGRVGYHTCIEKVFGCEANNPVQIAECEALGLSRYAPDFWEQCDTRLWGIQMFGNIAQADWPYQPSWTRRREEAQDSLEAPVEGDASLEAPVEGDASLEAPVEGDASVEAPWAPDTFYEMKFEIRVESSKAAEIKARVESADFSAILAAQIEEDQDLPEGTIALAVEPPIAAGDQCTAKDCSFHGTPSGSIPDCTCSCDAGYTGDDCSECTNQMWDQCGGKLFEGGSCCPTGATCFQQTQWYSQCLTTCPDHWDCATGAAPVADNGCPNEEWAQCGGAGFEGEACCKADMNCVQTNGEWYSQCQRQA